VTGRSDLDYKQVKQKISCTHKSQDLKSCPEDNLTQNFKKNIA
jgi:hypothetical protein